MTGVLETLCFRITRHCNLACSHCRAGSSPAMRDNADVDGFLEFAGRARRLLGLRHVSISGGEPAMDKRLVRLVAGLADLDLFVSITTNGTLLVSEILRPIFLRFPNLVRVRVSIDGGEAAHDQIRGSGTYAKATRELQRVLANSGWVGLNSVVTEEVLDSAPDLAAFAIKCGVPEWALISPVPQGTAAGMPWTAERYRPLLEKFRDLVRTLGYVGRLRIWDYLSTPRSSVLVEPSGAICLSGIRDDDAIEITTIARCDFSAIEQSIRHATRSTGQSHFKWTGWT